MKNKVVKQLLMVCAIASLVASNPVMTWASDSETTEQESKESDSINISKKGVETSIYEDEKLAISIYSATYTLDASDIILNMSIKNSYPNILTLKIQDAKVDDEAIVFKWDSEDYKAGTFVESSWYIALEDLQAIKCSDFKKLSFTTVGTLNDGTEVFQKEITMERNAFKSVEDESSDSSTEENNDSTGAGDSTSTEDTSSIDSQADDKYEELSQKIEELEAKNKELEDKNKELEDKLSKAEEEKNQEETPTPEPTAAPAEDTPTPEPTTEPTEEPAQEEVAPETEQKPVVEYKDATTIRIVQQALNDAGYNCGNPDGVAGGKTTEAVTKYQTDKGLTINGQVTDELLQSLNVVEKVQDAVQKEESSGAAKVDDIFRRLEDLGKNTLLQVTDPFEEDGVKGYVINFKNTLYTSLVNPDNEVKISIFIAPQEKYMDNIDSSEFIDMMAYMAQAFDSTLSSKEAYSVIADTINNESCNKNGYEYTFYKSLLGMTMTN